MIIIVSCGHNPDDERIYHREIKSLLKAGYDIRYFTRWNGEMDLSATNLHHINVKRKKYPIKKYIQFVSDRINDVSVLHLHEFELLPLAKKMKKKMNAKIVYDVHENLRDMWDTFSSKKGLFKKITNKLLSFFELSHLMYVDEVILANRVFGENYYEQKGLKTTVVENFPSIDKISDPNFPPDSKLIIYQGQVSVERGVSVLIDAFKLVHDVHANVRLRIIGSPRTDGLFFQIKNKINQMKLSDYIDLIKAVPHDVIWEEMKKANIGVIPFLDTPLVRTNTPTKLFEYMAAGCAVVASDVPPIRYYLEKNGELVTPGSAQSLADGIIKVMGNDSLFKKYLSEGKSKIRNHYNWEMEEKKLLNVYESLEI